jgi:hypothetical protein
MNLEIKKGEWEGAKKAKDEIISTVEKEKEKEQIAAEKENQKIWTLLERLQLLTPILLCLGFIIYIIEKFTIMTKLIKLIKEAWPF